MQEPYAESPGGQRLVQYFDKSRMEINNPNNPNAVTNGLLANELISGRLQTGDASFEERTPAYIPVAGDPDDTDGPVYATFRELLTAAPKSVGAVITDTLNRAGTRGNDAGLARYAVTAAYLVPETNHVIASPFWAFLQTTGQVQTATGLQTEKLFEPTFFATGFPSTEAYWARVKVAGQVKDVLMQCFQRRCLTYTPANPEGFQVEMGNVGQHYYGWRYREEGKPPGPPPVKSAQEIVLQLADLPAGYRVREERPEANGIGYTRTFEAQSMAQTNYPLVSSTALTAPNAAAAAAGFEQLVEDLMERDDSSTEAITGVGEQVVLHTEEVETDDDVTFRVTLVAFRRGAVLGLLTGVSLPERSDPAPLIQWAKIMDERAARYAP